MASFEILAEAVKAAEPGLSFTILEIGALPVSDTPEPFHSLLEAFPGSRIVAFELDPRLCESMNKHLPPAIRYYAAALGRTEETRPLYLTVMPMCTSLYRPNEALLSLYNSLDDSMLKSIGSVDTISLDRFTDEHGVADVDFVKIDVQGAELDIFEGGTRTIGDVVAIVSEVEFVPLYVDQPLFGDVCGFLAQQGLMFHKFTGVGGRALRPTVLNKDPTYAVQMLWADALYIRDIQKLDTSSPSKLLKLSMLAQIYGSPDLTLHCLKLYDEQRGTHVLQKVLGRM